MITVLRSVELLVLGLWLGGMVVFSFVVAPAAFSVLPSRQLAGELVTHVLSRLYLLSYGFAVVYVVALVLEQRLTGGSLRALWLPLSLVVLALLAVFLNDYWLTGRMVSLRTEMQAAFGGVDATPAEHALRVAFNRLHRYSVALLTADLLLVLALFVLTVRRLR